MERGQEYLAYKIWSVREERGRCKEDEVKIEEKELWAAKERSQSMTISNNLSATLPNTR